MATIISIMMMTAAATPTPMNTTFILLCSHLFFCFTWLAVFSNDLLWRRKHRERRDVTLCCCVWVFDSQNPRRTDSSAELLWHFQADFLKVVHKNLPCLWSTSWSCKTCFKCQKLPKARREQDTKCFYRLQQWNQMFCDRFTTLAEKHISVRDDQLFSTTWY